MKRRSANSGFTLIELMFVVAVIAILASAALPAYQDYTVRARLSEAIGLSQVGRHGVAEYYGRWGRMPADNAAAGLLPPEAYRGRVVKSLEIRDGVVRVLVAPLSSAGNARTYTLYVRPAVPLDTVLGALTWTCNQAGLPGFQVVGVVGNDAPPPRYLPGSCR